ncbi:MAG: purine-binding chemotaxis protein CheW [Lentisphaeraceae bacterium]|nr:purine-binding chemotaxis protein CheW [Lentisphaeraceae bacterium]
MSEEQEASFEDQDTQKDKYLTFHIGSEDYAIAITHVTEIIGMLKITDVPQTPNYIKGVINLRGKVIPVMDIRLRFRMAARDYDERTCVIVVNFHDNTVGLVVDTVSEVLDIPAENVESSPHFNNTQGGNFICGMGKIAEAIKMIIDVNALLFEDEELVENLSHDTPEES